MFVEQYIKQPLKGCERFMSLNGILREEYVPRWRVKIFFEMASDATGISQYPDLQTTEMNAVASVRESKHSFTMETERIPPTLIQFTRL